MRKIEIGDLLRDFVTCPIKITDIEPYWTFIDIASRYLLIKIDPTSRKLLSYNFKYLRFIRPESFETIFRATINKRYEED